MPLLHLIILAIIQGVTEFLPVSSSAHLILFPALTGTTDQGPVIDVAVHLGTLLAVMLYFHGEVRKIFFGASYLLKGRATQPEARFALYLIYATLPAIAVGLMLKLSGVSGAMRENVALIGWAMLGFGLLLWWADRRPKGLKTVSDFSRGDALKLGLWQALALIPGTSRSGITITGALLAGYSRHEAARLSMLMSIPVILAATALASLDLIAEGATTRLRDAALAAAFAAFSAFIALGLMMRLLRSISFTPYVIYRVVFGAGLILWASL